MVLTRLTVEGIVNGEVGHVELEGTVVDRDEGEKGAFIQLLTQWGVATVHQSKVIREEIFTVNAEGMVL